MGSNSTDSVKPIIIVYSLSGTLLMFKRWIYYNFCPAQVLAWYMVVSCKVLELPIV